MKLLLIATCVGLGSFGRSAHDAQDPAGVDVAARYRAAAIAQDRDGLAELWLAHPAQILGTFDADLEAGLAAWEASEEGHEERTRTLFARALWGAEVASEATGRRIFADYAGAFIGWSADQRKSFRAGQKAFGAALGALREGQHADALAQGKDCRERATRLGDWWGAAMGYYAEGAALRQLGRLEEASAALGLARLINHDLGLRGAEFAALDELVACLVSMDAGPRAGAALRGAIALARELGREERAAGLEETLADLGGR